MNAWRFRRGGTRRETTTSEACRPKDPGMARSYTWPFCNQPVDPRSPHVRREIEGWVNTADPDTVIEPTPTGLAATPAPAQQLADAAHEARPEASGPSKTMTRSGSQT